MKEIIYIQAGSLANHVGTHFWNTEASYFSSEGDEDVVDHAISFKESYPRPGEVTYCPRLLAFDYKSNVGPVSNVNEAIDGTDISMDRIWSGQVIEQRQEPTLKSKYQLALEEESDPSDTMDNSIVHGLDGTDARFWSDYSRVFYAPRTIHRLPDATSWEASRGDWFAGKEAFTRYDEDVSLMEEALRLSVEECDQLQGLQIIHDTATFGSFMDSFLTSFRDEYSKLPTLTFSLLSHTMTFDFDHPGRRSQAITDALCLRSLDDLSSMSVSLVSPQLWTKGPWFDELNYDAGSMYHTSAILSTHIESSTLPLRLAKSSTDLSALCVHLNRRGNTRFAELSGAFPANPSVHSFDKRIYNFSVPLSKATIPFSQITVSRGFSPSDVAWYTEWVNTLSLREPFLASIHSPPYPLPTSYPSFLKSRAQGHDQRHDPLLHLPTATVLSSLATQSSTSRTFEAYATFIGNCLKRKVDLGDIGLEPDEAKELENELWTLHDNYAEEERKVDGGYHNLLLNTSTNNSFIYELNFGKLVPGK